jgi:HD-like signal output (HDOD) protein
MNKHEIFRKIAEQISVGSLVFPTGVQVALKIQRALDDPGCHINTAVNLIKAEPMLAAKVISIANSVAYNRSGREIADLNFAVSMLGLGTIRSLAMTLVTRQMAGKAESREQENLVNKLWMHSAEVASLAHAIARRVTHINPETALFAGIIHDIGGFYMISRAKEFPGLLEGDFAEWLDGGEVIVGRAVLKNLHLPDSILQIVESFWDGYLSMPPVTFADTLLLAKELATTPSPLHRLENDGTPGKANAGAISTDVNDSNTSSPTPPPTGEGLNPFPVKKEGLAPSPTGGGLGRGDLPNALHQYESHPASASIEMLIGEETLAMILKESAEEIFSLNKALQN